jgi:hypothetical protein
MPVFPLFRRARLRSIAIAAVLAATVVPTHPPAQQRFMAQRAGARTVEVKAGHLSMISRPRAVVRLILDAVRATR